MVEISVNVLKIRCIFGFGPQEKDSNDRKEKFWAQLDYESTSAQNQVTGLIIQMADPHPRKKMATFLKTF